MIDWYKAFTIETSGVGFAILSPLCFVPFMGSIAFKRGSFYKAYAILQVTFVVAMTGLMQSINHNLIYIIFSLAGFCFMLIAVRTSYLHLIFVFLLVMNFGIGVQSFSELLVSLIVNTFGTPLRVTNIIVPYFVYLLTVPFVIRFLRKAVMPLFEGRVNHPIWRIMWILPCLFIILQIFADFDANISDYNWTKVLFSFGNALSYYVIFKMANEIMKLAHHEEAERFVSNMLDLQKQHYKDLTRFIEESKKAKHDFRHHIVAISSLLKSQDYQKLEAYLAELQTLTPPDTDIFYCDNLVVNAMINHYLSMLKETNILTTFKVFIPNPIGISDIDLCLVIGNLLENATHAALKKKDGFICVQVMPIGQMLVITVDNTFTGELEKADVLFQSTKHEGQGIGLASVSAIVEKYGGAAIFRVHETGVFEASVSMFMGGVNSETLPR